MGYPIDSEEENIRPVFIKIPMNSLKWVSWEDNKVHITYKDERTETYESNLVLLTNDSEKSEVE